MNTDNEQKPLDGTGASIEQDLGGHPLFPRPETENGPDLRRFDHIQIHRWLSDGTKEVCPKVWRGNELRSWEQIIDLYGGECTYQLMAQCGKTHRFQAYSEKFYFSGPARKPFHHDGKRLGENGGPMPPQHQQPPAIDIATMFQFMLEREARASEKQLEREMRTAEYQARMQETLVQIALNRPAPPNPFEGVRDVVQLMQTMNNQPSATSTGADPVKMLERGIAMGKELAGEGTTDEIPWGTVINAAATGLSLLKKSKSDENKDEKKEETKEKPQSAPPPSPTAAVHFAPNPQPNAFVDPRTGIAYTYHPNLGFIPIDQAVALFRAHWQHQQMAAQTHSPYPVAAPPMPQQMPIPHPMPTAAPPIPAPPMVPPPQTTRMAPPPRPMPHPVPPPAPMAPAPITPAPITPSSAPRATSTQQPPPTVRSPRPQAMAEAAKNSPAVPPQQNAPPKRAHAQSPRGQPPASTSNAATVIDAFDERSGDCPLVIGSDFADVVNEGMNSPIAQQIMQHPRYRELWDAATKGERSATDVGDEFLEILGASEGGLS